jgi:hypothetical protein
MLGDGLNALCIISWPCAFRGSGAEWYALNMKCLQDAHLLNIWSPAGGAVWEDCGNFRRWGLAGGIRSPRAWLWRLYLASIPVSLSLLLVICHEVNSLLLHKFPRLDVLPTFMGQATMDWASEIVSKINPSSPRLFLSGILHRAEIGNQHHLSFLLLLSASGPNT